MALAGAVVAAVMVAGCSRSAQTYLDRGDSAIAKGDVAAAILEYRNAVGRDPMAATARLKLAEAYLRVGDNDKGIAEYLRAADLLPSDLGVQVKAGSLLLLIGRAEDAKARADRALAVNARSIDALVLRANALAGLTDLEGALKEMQVAVSLDPGAAVRSNLGAIQTARGDLPAAEAAFRQAVAADPRSVNAQLALAQFLWASQRWAEAEAAFKSTLALDPAAAQTNAALAQLYIQSGRAKEAEPHLKKVAEVALTAESKLALADYYTGMRRPEAALAVLEQLSSDRRYWAAARAKTAELQHRVGKSAEAMRTIEEVLARQPGFAAARLARGRILLAQGNVDEAWRDVQLAQKANSLDPEAQYMVGAVQEAKGNLGAAAAAYSEVLRAHPRAGPAQVRLAAIQMQLHDLDAASRHAEQAAASEPESVAAQLVLARVLLMRGEFDRAAVVTQRLASSFPDVAAVQSQVGMLALARGDRAAARAAFEQAVALNDPTIQSLQALVSLDLEESKPDRARARVEQRLTKTPRDSAALAVAGRMWGALGDPAKAEEFLRRSVEADPANLEVYMDLARVYISRGKLEPAIEEFDRLAERQPDAVGPPTMAALLVQSQGKAAEAQQRYERLVEKNRHAAVASNNLAWMLASRGEQLDRALQLAQAAKAAIPDDPEVNDTLAFVYIKKQLPALAVPLLRLAVQRQPRNPAFAYHLGLAYAQAGDKAAARASIDKALGLASDFDGADHARAVRRSLD